MPEFSPAFAGGEPDDLKDLMAEEARQLSLYERPKNIRITNTSVAGSETQIPVRLYQPVDASGELSAGPHPLFIWFHGGAFVFGNIDMGEAEFTACEIASRANAVVISVDYRLANPFVRFPAPQVDALDVLLWARENAGNLKADANNVFIGGGSAGACLSGALSLMARDRGIELKGVLPIYPLAHEELPAMSDEVAKLVEGIHYLTQEFCRLHNGWLIEGVAAQTAAQRHCFPGDSADKSGQAPFLVIHAERDSLRATGELWVQQLRASGVWVDEMIEPGALHGYLSMGPSDAGANHTLDVMARWIKARSK